MDKKRKVFWGKFDRQDWTVEKALRFSVHEFQLAYKKIKMNSVTIRFLKSCISVKVTG